jgi:membrane-anchored mycosin MYCP
VPALKTEPWAQRQLDFTRVWPLTRGRGVTVAVVDSGVDAAHPQLAGHVTSVDVTHTMTRDCIGHGTAVAGIIAAQDRRSNDLPLVGVAPGVHLISVKFTNEDHTDGPDPRLPEAIRRAVTLRAKVINVSVTAPDTAALRSAVRFAQAHDAVVVAAAGNVTDEDKGTVGPAYPAAYPDVIGVGSLNPDGSVADSSNTETKVSVSAPGKEIATTWPGGYAPSQEGTSFAAAFVSGTVALVRAYHPGLDHNQVKARIEATADGANGAGSGAGMIDPMQAVTALLPGEGSGAGVTAPPDTRSIRVAYRRPPDRRTRSVAFLVTGVALGASALAVAGGVFIPMGRRRGWRPGRPARPGTDDRDA